MMTARIFWQSLENIYRGYCKNEKCKMQIANWLALSDLLS